MRSAKKVGCAQCELHKRLFGQMAAVKPLLEGVEFKIFFF